ncbi:MAG: hypothetical protein QG608_3749 [Actinomycetota bacterium]|nr:hypothetical protein [Actinomycetota bacterium]
MEPVLAERSASPAQPVWSWVLGRGGLPTTPEGVEAGALTVFLGIRFVNLVQLAMVLPVSLRHTTRPAVFVAVLAGFVAETVVLTVVLVRAGHYADRRWGRADALTSALALLLQPTFTGPRDITGDWTAWAFACTLSTVVGAAIVFPRRREFSFVVALLAVSYFAAAFPHADEGQVRATVLGNTLAYPGFALLSRLLLGYLRKLSQDAEAARSEATRAAAFAAGLRELERQRSLLHDSSKVLRQLSEPRLPQELEITLKSQAVVLTDQIRAFLEDPLQEHAYGGGTDRPGASGSRSRPLVQAVQEALADTPGLPVEQSLTLATGVELAGPAAEALTLAVATVLNDVRVRAQARGIVVRADADPEEGGWEVTVIDDGQGLDPESASAGSGLWSQVKQNLAGHGISARVHPVPGEGTRVTLTGTIARNGKGSR